MSEKDKYILKRRKKRIVLKQIAKYIGCSLSLISRYETGSCEMDKDKIRKYRKYIDEYK